MFQCIEKDYLLSAFFLHLELSTKHRKDVTRWKKINLNNSCRYHECSQTWFFSQQILYIVCIFLIIKMISYDTKILPTPCVAIVTSSKSLFSSFWSTRHWALTPSNDTSPKFCWGCSLPPAGGAIEHSGTKHAKPCRWTHAYISRWLNCFKLWWKHFAPHQLNKFRYELTFNMFLIRCCVNPFITDRQHACAHVCCLRSDVSMYVSGSNRAIVIPPKFQEHFENTNILL